MTNQNYKTSLCKDSEAVAIYSMYTILLLDAGLYRTCYQTDGWSKVKMGFNRNVIESVRTTPILHMKKVSHPTD